MFFLSYYVFKIPSSPLWLADFNEQEQKDIIALIAANKEDEANLLTDLEEKYDISSERAEELLHWYFNVTHRFYCLFSMCPTCFCFFS